MAGDYIAEVEIHPAAQMFPEMGHEELLRLSESIKRDGAQHPIAFYDGKLLDGRNRLRACHLVGIPTQKIPKINIPPETDPYVYAWSANCERLDYTKAQKVELYVRVLKESGQWDKLKREAEESRRDKNREATKAQPRAEDGTLMAAATKDGRGPDGVSANMTDARSDRRKSSTAAAIAHMAQVSQRTVERALAKKKETPASRLFPAKKRQSAWVPKKWRGLFGSMTKLAAYLQQNVPSTEIHKLCGLLGYEQARGGAKKESTK